MTNTVAEIRAKTLFDVIKEPCGMDTILSTEDLCRDFKIGDGSVVNALKNINIEIEKGKVMFGGRDITRLSERARDDIRRYKMAFVFQSVALMSGMTAYENVDFGLRLAKYPYEERDKRTRECLRSVGLEKRMFHRPGEMSGGEQQRVAIARAIAHKPDIIFADEPTAELDTATALHVVKLFKELVARDEMTIIMTTHDPSMIDIADKVYTLEDGEIVE